MKEQIALIKKAFGDCKRLHTSECISQTSYEVLSLSNFYIFDDTKDDLNPVKIVGAKYPYQLTVKNLGKEEICLIKSDKCLFTDKHKKCDCILFNKTKFYFIEISETRNKTRKRKEAAKQLGDTIENFRENNIDLSSFETKAIICFKNGQTRPTQPSLNTKRAIFLEKYNVSLEEGNEVSF